MEDSIRKEYDSAFDNPNGERPYMAWPKIHGDSRGSFMEVLTGNALDEIKQINRSTSCALTVRGMHAQAGQWCQSKLVEALTQPIYDIIVDARPDSKTFGMTAVYYLDPVKQNMLYVPHGFLHGFAVPKLNESQPNAVFMYYCDQMYNAQSEVHVHPMSVLENAAKTLNSMSEHQMFTSMIEDKTHLVMSSKDLASEDYCIQMQKFLDDYKKTGNLWYKA